MKVNKLIWLFVAALSLWSCNDEDEGYPIATNRGPVMLAQSFNPSENIPDTFVIGSIKAFDADGDPLTYSLTMNDGDTFELTPDGTLSLAAGKNLDFETKSQYSLTVSVTDGITNPITNNVTIEVENVIENLFEDPEAFITEWEISAGQALTIGTSLEYDYDYTIDWGDGTGENELTTFNPTHEYTDAGTYRIAIKGQFPAVRMSNSDTASKESLINVAQWGTVKWQSMEQAFADCVNLTGFSATDMHDLSETTSMMGMFYMASSFNGSLGNWNTGAVTNMQNMFMGAEAFNQSIGTWDTGNVASMDQMFNGAVSFNQNITEWNTGNVMSFSGMFMGAISFNQNISSWDTAQASSMQGMFSGAEVFDQNLGGWTIENATSMEGMLDNSGMSAENLSSTLIGWNDYVEENEGPKDITLGVDGLSVCGPEVVEAIQNLTINHQWAFTGQLQSEENCPEEEEETEE